MAAVAGVEGGAEGGADPAADAAAREAYWEDDGLLRRLLEEENAMRTARATQLKMALTHAPEERLTFDAAELERLVPQEERPPPGADWIDVADREQERVVERHLPRFRTEATARQRHLWLDSGLRALRTAGEGRPELAALSLWRRHNRAAPGLLRVGDPLVDAPLLPLAVEGKEAAAAESLAALAARHRALLVLAGSSTWPPFVALAPALAELAARGAHAVVVYVEEAHAADEWPIGRRHAPRQPRTTKERRAVAAAFAAASPLGALSWYLDTPDNAFARAYAPWPTHFYLFCGGRLAHVAEPVDARFLLGPTVAALDACLAAEPAAPAPPAAASVSPASSPSSA